MIQVEVTIVDPRDRELEELLHACSARTATIPGAALATLAHPSAHQPAVLAVDLRGGRPLPPAIALLKRHHPATPVLIATSSADRATLLEAMRAGVNEVLAEPISRTDLEAALQRLSSIRRSDADGRVYAFLGAKGGVGTTTAAVNVAAWLSRQGTTLLADLHLSHGDAAVFLGAEPRFSIVDALENTHRFDDAFFRGLVTPTKGGPDLLASSDRSLVHGTTSDQFRTLIEFTTRLYQYVVLDVPRSDAAALDALDRAARVVVVANQELATVRNASRVAAALRQRYGKERVEVILSRYDRQADIGQDDIERVAGVKLSHTIPSDYRAAVAALNRGRPLTIENHNGLASSYVSIAKRLMDPAAAEAAKAEEPRLFRWLKGRA